MRMVESSMNSASAIAAKDQPRSSSRMAFARRETRFSSRPSLAIATRSARSAALRKLRFVFTRRVESIPLIRSTDFRKNEESRYSTVHDLEAIGGRFDLSGLSEPRIEPEIAFHITAAPRPDMSARELIDCVDWIAHGFEIVQSIFPKWRFTAADSVAAYGLHGAYFLGERHSIADGPRELVDALSSFAVDLLGEDGVVRNGHATDVLGGPLEALRHLVRALDSSAEGDPLRPGELVTTGTLTDAPLVAAGQTWSTRLSGIPLEGLRLRFDSGSAGLGSPRRTAGGTAVPTARSLSATRSP